METEIRGLSLDPDDHSAPFAPVTNLDGAVALDYSSQDNMVYFSQVKARKISKFNVNNPGAVQDIAAHSNVSGHCLSIYNLSKKIMLIQVITCTALFSIDVW